MLSYLILTTRALVMAAVIMGVSFGYTRIKGNIYHKRIVFGFTIVGIIASAVIAYFRNATSKLDSAIMNGWLYSVSLVSLVLFFVFSLKAFANSKNRVISSLRWVFLGLILTTVAAYAMSDVWAYPYHVLLSEKTIISTDFLLSMIGMIFGIILAAVMLIATMKTVMRMKEREMECILWLELLLNAALRISGLYSVLIQKKIIKSNHTLFTYTVFVKNNSDRFIFASLLVIVIAAICLFVRSFNRSEPYRNPAEKRKIKARWRSIRRWGLAAVIASAVGVCNLTVVEAMNATDVTLSPIEDATAVDDENVYVSFELVNDGHLHRFAYETKDGVAIRFIVIQKPGSSSYGIGLDACDVCGETGYYEKDGQVVCNLCDVVMNISTIGFKGGCNPIVIPYEIAQGQIIVPISGLMEYESEFK